MIFCRIERFRGSHTANMRVANAIDRHRVETKNTGTIPTNDAITPPISGLAVAADVSAVVDSANRIGISSRLPNSRTSVVALII